MLLMGALIALAMFLLIMKLSRKIRMRIIGHNGISDIGLTTMVVLMFGATLTISGMMAGIVAGVLISGVLFLAKKLMPHSTWDFSKRKFEDHEPEWKREEHVACPPYEARALRNNTRLWSLYKTVITYDWVAIIGLIKSLAGWCLVLFGILMAVIWIPHFFGVW